MTIPARVLSGQIGWAVLAALWNSVSVALISAGSRALGPTASMAAAILLIIMAGLFPLLAAPHELACMTPVLASWSLAAIGGGGINIER